MNKATLPALVLGLAGVSLLLLSLAGLMDVPVHQNFIQGEIDASRVDIAAKISGRVDQQLVQDGTQVKEGDELIVLDCPEVLAKIDQAKAALAAAQAVQAKAHKGVREEELKQAETAYGEALAGLAMARKTYKRIKELFEERAMSAQQFDDAQSKFLMATERANRARAALDMARAGARQEDIDAADAQVERARATLAEVLSMSRDIRLSAPVNGEVSKVLVRKGELVAPGYPLVSLVKLDDVWAVIQLREDLLSRLKMGDTFVASVPALDNRKVTFRVNYIAPLGDFATWRATNNSGTYDLKTFEVHGQPVEAVPGLRPGMSVIFDLEENKAAK